MLVTAATLAILISGAAPKDLNGEVEFKVESIYSRSESTALSFTCKGSSIDEIHCDFHALTMLVVSEWKPDHWDPDDADCTISSVHFQQDFRRVGKLKWVHTGVEGEEQCDAVVTTVLESKDDRFSDWTYTRT